MHLNDPTVLLLLIGASTAAALIALAVASWWKLDFLLSRCQRHVSPHARPIALGALAGGLLALFDIIPGMTGTILPTIIGVLVVASLGVYGLSHGTPDEQIAGNAQDLPVVHRRAA